jgi:DNA-binding NarL/FixJ family response regulator
MQKNKVSILLADDHLLAREGIRSLLEKVPDMEIVGEAQDGNEIKRLVAKLLSIR